MCTGSSWKLCSFHLRSSSWSLGERRKGGVPERLRSVAPLFMDLGFTLPPFLKTQPVDMGTKFWVLQPNLDLFYSEDGGMGRFT